MGLSNTEKVGKKPEGSGPRSHWPVPALLRTQHQTLTLRVAGWGVGLSPTTPQKETEGVWV